MRVLLLASHAVAEFDDIRMFHDLGYEVFAPGGYEDPSSAGEGARPALPEVPYYADLAGYTRTQREKYGDPGSFIDWGKARLHPEVIEWADVIIGHHFVDRWLAGQWSDIRHKRVIWRTCGQSNPELERHMTPLVDDGLQIVRYSPAEEHFFGDQGAFAGEHALIRFGKYIDDYGPWTGENRAVGNLTQDMHNRGDACGLSFWQAATASLPAAPAGKGSEALPGGLGELSYEAMLTYLRTLRAYLYTGTTPASYTLGLIEAMLSGVPVVSIARGAWGDGWGGAHLFEADTIVGYATSKPAEARDLLATILNQQDVAQRLSHEMRTRAVDLFDVTKVGQQWRDFLEAV